MFRTLIVGFIGIIEGSTTGRPDDTRETTSVTSTVARSAFSRGIADVNIPPIEAVTMGELGPSSTLGITSASPNTLTTQPGSIMGTTEISAIAEEKIGEQKSSRMASSK